MQGDLELRKNIDDVTAIRFPGQFKAAWEMLVSMGGHRLYIVESDGTYNCHAHALRIERIARFQELFKERGGEVLAKGDFVADLIERGEIRIIDGQSYGPDHIVIYFKDGKPTHSARVVEKDGLLVSKWGGNELIEHALWEVPTYYGDEYKVAIAPDPKRAMELLIDWLPKIA